MRLVMVALGWALGMAMAHHGVLTHPVTWAALLALMVALVFLNCRNRPFRWFNFACLALTFGGLRYAVLPISAPVAAYIGDSLTITGVVVDAPELRETQILLRVDAEQADFGIYQTSTDGTVLVQAGRDEAGTVHYGDRVSATGVLRHPATSDTFNYADYLARSGIYAVMEDVSLEVLAHDQGGSFRAALIDLRERVVGRIYAALPEPQAGLLAGILTGDESTIARDTEDAFRDVGVAHVLAISGFNMVVIAGVVLGTFRALFPDKTWWPTSAALIIIVIYALFAGASPPILRAALMTMILFVAQGFRRKTFVPASIALVTLLLTAFDPHILWDAGFQLSVCAVLGLAFFADPLQRGFSATLQRLLPEGIAGRLADVLQVPLVVTLAAQIAVTPLSLLYFGRVSLAFLPVNLLIVPVQAYVLYFGGLGVLLSFVPVVGQFFFWVAMLFLSWTVGVVRLFAELPIAAVDMRLSPQAVGWSYLVIMGWAIMTATRPDIWLKIKRFLQARWLMSGTAFLSVALLVLMLMGWMGRPRGTLDVWFLDMGHSNAALIQTPDGAQILVDGGRYPARLLTALGDHLPFYDREIELVIVSQPDEYDAGALASVLGRYDAGIVLTNGQPNLGAWWDDLQSAWSSSAEVITVRAGYTVTLSDGVVIEVLSPQVAPSLGASLDDGALTVRVRYGDVSFLLPGDLSAEGQAALVDGAIWPSATVLQVPRHGAERGLSADFLAAVDPSAAVMQIDRANRLGDPAPSTLEMLGADVALFRTDEGGAVHFWTDGERLWARQEGS